jgi:hypothetical protein
VAAARVIRSPRKSSVAKAAVVAVVAAEVKATGVYEGLVSLAVFGVP